MIGVFDSGFGGLTVCKEIIRQIPGQDIIYYADLVNFPYGTKEPGQLRGFNRRLISFLQDHGAQAVVVACNTASTVLDEGLVQDFALPIIDVISSGARSVKDPDLKRLGLIATEATIESGILQARLEDQGTEVIARPAQLLVDLAQSRRIGPEAEQVVKESIQDFASLNIDGLYLGCTHFSLIKDLISKQLGVPLIDPAACTARDLKEYFASQAGPSKLFYHSSGHDKAREKEEVRKILAGLDVVVR